MDKIKIVAKVGIGLAIIDLIIRGFGPLYTTNAQEYLTLTHFISISVMPAIAILASLGLISAKKWGLYLAIIFAIIAFIPSLSTFSRGEPNILPILYFIIYGSLSFLGLKRSNNLK